MNTHALTVDPGGRFVLNKSIPRDIESTKKFVEDNRVAEQANALKDEFTGLFVEMRDVDQEVGRDLHSEPGVVVTSKPGPWTFTSHLNFDPETKVVADFSKEARCVYDDTAEVLAWSYKVEDDGTKVYTNSREFFDSTTGEAKANRKQRGYVLRETANGALFEVKE